MNFDEAVQDEEETRGDQLGSMKLLIDSDCDYSVT